MKKILSLVLVFVLVFGLSACGKTEQAPAEKPAEVTETTQEENKDSEEEGEVISGENVTLEQPILLTSVGQSADVEMVKSMLKKIGVDFTANNLATSDDIGSAKTLVLAIGGSSKGLGAAGIDAEGELARIDELTKAAKDQGLKILAVHVGGEARRGELSDKFIGPSFENADYAIVVKSGDSDGLMSDLASKQGVPIELIGAITDVAASLENIFK